MIRELGFAVPGDLSTPTGGYAYDRRMIAELERLGWSVAVLGLGDGFPWPGTATREAALARLAAVPAGRPIVVDGLALGALPEIVALRDSHVLVALVHHPLALESGLSAREAKMLRASERAALAAASHVVTTSRTTARIVAADYGVPPARITVAPPGTDAVAAASGTAISGAAIELLAVGAVTHRKGHDVLIAALAQLAGLPWRLTIVGDRSRDEGASARLEADISRLGLERRIELAGVVSPQRLATLYRSADVFVLASRFEGYGMAYAEAIAHGLPVIGTTAGAIPEAVAAGLLVPPEDVSALAAALRTLITDGRKRARLAAASRSAACALPTWLASGRLVAAAVEAAVEAARRGGPDLPLTCGAGA